jgi:hypothetical protein
LVSREALYDRLDDGGHQPLALVSGILNLLLAVMGIVTWNVEG